MHQIAKANIYEIQRNLFELLVFLLLQLIDTICNNSNCYKTTGGETTRLQQVKRTTTAEEPAQSKMCPQKEAAGERQRQSQPQEQAQSQEQSQPQAQSQPQPQAQRVVRNLPTTDYAKVELLHSQPQPQAQRVVRNLPTTDYAKVEILHRMLVAQQLQQLEQRRLMRLAIARKRLNFELSN